MPVKQHVTTSVVVFAAGEIAFIPSSSSLSILAPSSDALANYLSAT
eukprot:IDg11923t1